MSHVVELDQWERQRLLSIVYSECLTYLGHYGTSGLFRAEVDVMNRMFTLASKLRGEPPPEPRPYRGTARNGFNPEAD